MAKILFGLLLQAKEQFKCSDCNSTFSTKCNLDRHKKIYHGEQKTASKFVCKCSKVIKATMNRLVSLAQACAFHGGYLRKGFSSARAQWAFFCTSTFLSKKTTYFCFLSKKTHHVCITLKNLSRNTTIMQTTTQKSFKVKR